MQAVARHFTTLPQVEHRSHLTRDFLGAAVQLAALIALAVGLYLRPSLYGLIWMFVVGLIWVGVAVTHDQAAIARDAPTPHRVC